MLDKVMQEGFDILFVWWPMELLACLVWTFFEKRAEHGKRRERAREKEQMGIAAAVSRVREMEKVRQWCRDKARNG